MKNFIKEKKHHSYLVMLVSFGFAMNCVFAVMNSSLKHQTFSGFSGLIGLTLFVLSILFAAFLNTESKFKGKYARIITSEELKAKNN